MSEVASVHGNQPERIMVFDTTLRDGDQTPGVNFSVEDKITIAQSLSELSVDIIEAGFPISTEGDFEAVYTIAQTIEDGPVICALSRTEEGDIEAAWAAIEPAKDKGGARIHTFIATSERHMEEMGKSPEEVIAAASSAVTKAREFTDDVEFSPEDASRSDFEFMMQVIMAAVDKGATTINVPDTVGYAMPSEYATRLRTVQERIEKEFGARAVTMSAHCHDDLGHATANTVAAIVEGGVRQIEVSTSGIGERAGNTDLAQVEATLHQRYPDRFQTGIDRSQLTKVSREVMWHAGIHPQPNTPVYGSNAFAHMAGIHQAKVLGDRQTYEHMVAEEYGNESRIVLGKLSGKGGVESHIAKIALQTDRSTLIAVTKQAKRMSDIEGRNVVDSDIEQLVSAQRGEELTDRVVLDHMHVESDTSGKQSWSKVEVKMIDGASSSSSRERGTACSEKGTVDAAIQAINNAIDFDGTMHWDDGDANEVGSDAAAGVFVTVTQGETAVSVYTQADSIDNAVILAYIDGINLLDRTQTRQRAINSQALVN
jgi:2-isopropylmalate synthase